MPGCAAGLAAGDATAAQLKAVMKSADQPPAAGLAAGWEKRKGR
jgi:hypothetical protein